MTDLRDRVSAVTGELLALTEEAVHTGDDALAQPLKEVRRVIKSLSGEQPFSGNAFLRLQARLAEEQGLARSAVEAAKAQYESRHEHLDLREQFIAEAEAALEERERTR